MTSRGQLMEQLIGRGLDGVERLTNELEDDAIEGAVRWYDGQMQLGRKITPGLLAAKLRDGGFAGFGVTPPKQPKAWWHDGRARAAWCDEHFSDEPDEAEAAVISLANAKKEITVDSVRKTIGWERQEDADFYGGGEYETKLMPPSGGDKSPWVSYTARKT